MKKGGKRRFDRAIGPAGSVLLHLLVFALLLKLLVFRAPPRQAQRIAVQVVERPAPPPPQKKKPDPPPESAEPSPLEEPSDLEQNLPKFEHETDLQEQALPALKGTVAAVKSPLKLNGIMAGRSATARRKLLREFGGRFGAAAEKAVVRGLDWLQSVQCPDGSWGTGKSRSMTARQERARLTGLALLAFLAHGETPQSEKYGRTVRRAIRCLLAWQDKASGRFCPFSKTIGPHDDIGVYGHAIATYALAEAYGLTRSPMLKQPVERGIQAILDGQQEGGGWDHRYQHERWSDLSVTGWQVQALRAAQAAGIEPEQVGGALEKSAGFVRGMHEGGGRFFYRKGNKKPSGGLDYMTGVAVLCLQMAGQGDAPEARAGLAYLRDKECTDWSEGWKKTRKNRSFNIAYEWYYNTQAIFQRGGARWTAWNNRFAPMLIAAQDPSGAWKPPSESAKKISKDIIYTTDFCILSLEVYYRFLPSFKRNTTPARPFVFDDDVKVIVR